MSYIALSDRASVYVDENNNKDDYLNEWNGEGSEAMMYLKHSWGRCWQLGREHGREGHRAQGGGGDQSEKGGERRVRVSETEGEGQSKERREREGRVKKEGQGKRERKVSAKRLRRGHKGICFM